MNEQGQINQAAVDAATDVKCDACGGEYFDQACALKKISAIDPNNPTGQPQLIPMGMFICRNCDAPLLSID